MVTITRALRNHPDIGGETRQRLLARVKELDYHPNLGPTAGLPDAPIS